MLYQSGPHVPEGHTGDAYEPARLFSALEPNQPARIAALVETYPVRASLALFALSVILPALTAFTSADRAENFWLDATPHLAIITLLVGWVFFPLRLSWVPLLGYALGVAITTAMRIASDTLYFPSGFPGWGFIATVAAANAGAVALALALARFAYLRLSRNDHGIRPYLALAGTAVVGAGLLLTLVQLLLLSGHDLSNIVNRLPPDSDASIYDLVVLRILRIIGFAGLFLLLFFQPFNRSSFIAAAIGIALGACVGFLRSMGLGLYPTIDPLLPLFFVMPLSRPHFTTVVSIAILITYETATDSYSASAYIPTHAHHVLEILASLGIVLLFTVLILLSWNESDRMRSEQTLRRLTRAQEFARVGYFVLDTATGKGRADPTGGQIIGVGETFLIADCIDRIAPEDLPVFLDATTRTDSDSVSFSYHKDMPPGQNPPRHFIKVYMWFEEIPGRGRMAYGALLDLTHEDERENQLVNALKRLSEQQDLQTRLFSIVSHELRTPASIISMLLEEMDSKGDWASAGPKLHHVTDQLLSVLADMRQTVRPDQNLPVRLEPVCPQDKLERLRSSFALLAEKHGMAIHIAPTSHSAVLRKTDRTRVVQTMSNLIKNAIVHSRARNIYLGYREEQAGADVTGVWSVADDGRGIPAADRARLFQPFSRLTNRTDKVDGSGLGLFVAKTAMELLGGSITCNDRPGGGTLFEIRVPMHPAAPTDSDIRAEKSGRDAVLHETFHTKTLLVAEDNDIMADILTALMSRFFGRVTRARTGGEALRIQSSDPHDVVLTDLFMPDLGGDGLTRALRETGFAGPVIGMTAADLGAERTAFETAGTTAVLTKPIKMAQFFDILSAPAG